jgi:uncharacterized membrane protein YbhN (UPF0104 family)
VRRLDVAHLRAALASASLPLVAVAAALNFVQLVPRALTLRVLVEPVRYVRVRRLYAYNLAMYAGNNLLPARAGEWLRIELLRAHEGVPRSTSLAVAVVEKLLDALALLALALPLPLFLPGLPRSVATASWLLGAGGIVGLVAVAWLAKRGAGATGRLAQLARGAAAVRHGRSLAAAVGWALLSHAIDATGIGVCLLAVHIDLPPAAAVVVLLAVTLVLALPSVPAGVGSLEVGAVAALEMLGVDSARALAFALVYHAMQVLPVTLVGLVVLRKARRSVRGDLEAGVHGVSADVAGHGEPRR